MAGRGAGKSGPSFDCARAATAIEQTICAEPALAADDAAMAELYAAAKVSAYGSGTSNIAVSQLAWLRERKGCERYAAQVWASRADCLRASYKARLGTLAVAALFAAPEPALETLRRVEPGAASRYEAIWLYASAPPGQEPTAMIAPLIASSFAPSADPEAAHWGVDLLGDEGIATPEQALASAAAFASFLQATGPYVESDTYPLAMPCAALIRRPALLNATAPLFGSSLDNGIMRADCAETLPPLPKFEALVEGIFRQWPECQGTIRYAFYRTFGLRADAARLGIAPESESALPARKVPGASPVLIAAATAELAASYVAHKGMELPGARRLAASTMAAMLGAGGMCDIGEDE